MRVKKVLISGASLAAVTAGLIAVQSGIPGTGTLPIARHAPASAAVEPGLPAPTEQGPAPAPVPAGGVAGTVDRAPTVTAVGVTRRTDADEHHRSGKGHSDGKGKGSGDDKSDKSGKGDGKGRGDD